MRIKILKLFAALCPQVRLQRNDMCSCLRQHTRCDLLPFLKQHFDYKLTNQRCVIACIGLTGASPCQEACGSTDQPHPEHTSHVAPVRVHQHCRRWYSRSPSFYPGSTCQSAHPAITRSCCFVVLARIMIVCSCICFFLSEEFPLPVCSLSLLV